MLMFQLWLACCRYVVSSGFLKVLQHEAARQVASMSPEAVAQARGGLDNFVARSKQRLEQHSQLQQAQHLQQLQQHLRIENALLLAPESAKKSFATKRTRLADGVDKRMVCVETQISNAPHERSVLSM